MADNFNLRQFLTENNLTKNAQLLNENVDIAQAFSQAGITGEVTVAFHSEHGMSEPEFEVMDAQDALAMIAREAEGAEDVIIAQGAEIDQQGDLDPQTQGLECKLEVAILDHGTYEVYQGSNEESLDEEVTQGTDISGYWVMYGGLNKGVPMLIKMFPSEEEAQQALQDAPTTYGQHVLRGNWGIQSAQDWLASGKELGPDSMGHPDRVPRKRLSPEELAAIRQLDLDAKMEREGTENKKPIMKETNLTAKERRLVEMVNSAMGYTNNDEDREFDPGQDIEQAQHDIERQYEGSEMPGETVIPEYNTIDELMNSIDHGTNKVAEEHKMQEMKKIAGMLREKAKRMEESEHAAHISPKDLKQLATDAAKLEKAAEKLKAAFDKKFNKKQKPASTPKAEKVEALQETTMENFNLKKFLVENKLTTNSRLIEEAGNTASGYERLHAKVDNLDRNIQVNAYQLLDFVNNLGGNVEDDMVIDAIFYTAQDNNADELISILADTMGMGGGSNDPLAFDGVFTYSDIQQALNGNEMDDNLKNQILDNDLIRHLERG